MVRAQYPLDTTTSLSPQQIHELGLSEVNRIRKEMDAVIAQTGFKGGFEKFSHFLRNDPQFYYKDAASLLRGYRDIASGRTRSWLGLRAAATASTGEAIPHLPKIDNDGLLRTRFAGRRAARLFCVNTYALDTRPKEMEALTLHELCRAIICRFPWRRKWRGRRSFASTAPTLLLSRVGAFTPRAWAPRWGFTKTLTRSSASSLTKSGAPSAGGGHGHALQGLEPPAGNRLFPRQQQQE